MCPSTVLIDVGTHSHDELFPAYALGVHQPEYAIVGVLNPRLKDLRHCGPTALRQGKEIKKRGGEG